MEATRKSIKKSTQKEVKGKVVKIAMGYLRNRFYCFNIIRNC